MNRKKIFFVIGALCIIAAFAMYLAGNESGNLSELKDFWWMPLPLAALALILANKNK